MIFVYHVWYMYMTCVQFVNFFSMQGFHIYVDYITCSYTGFCLWFVTVLCGLHIQVYLKIDIHCMCLCMIVTVLSWLHQHVHMNFKKNFFWNNSWFIVHTLILFSICYSFRIFTGFRLGGLRWTSKSVCGSV